MQNSSKVIGLCAFAVIAALLVVGIVSGGIVRHIVQTAPVWIAVTLGLRGSQAAKWAALPVFLFWLFIVSLIWLFLLGIAKIVSGTYSPVEVAMTIVVGLASFIGIIASIRAPKGINGWTAVIIFILVGGVQVGAMAIGLNPPVSSDKALLEWMNHR